MKMTTEEAFVKVLQMHGIEHVFGIIGSAFMPISDLFPKAGITFWDVAHESNGGLICDGYTRIHRQNGDGHRSKRPRHHQPRHRHKDSLLEPHADAAGHATGGEPDDRSGRFPGSRANGAVPRHGRLSGRGARSCTRCGSVESRHFKSEASVSARADQHPPRLTGRKSSTSACRRSSSSSVRLAAPAP